jgi:hypothetical protein
MATKDRRSHALNVENNDILKTSVLLSKRRMISKARNTKNQRRPTLHGMTMG